MFKVLITPHSEMPYVFETLVEANAWLAKNIANNSFGKPDRWVRERDFTGDESTTTATIDEATGVSFRELDAEFDLPVIEYHFDCEYTITGPTDVTEKYNKAKAKQDKVNKGRAKKDVCQTVFEYILGSDLEDNIEVYGNIIESLSKNKVIPSRNLIEQNELIDATIKEDLLSFFTGE